LLLMMCLSNLLQAQETFILRGVVRDAAASESLMGVNIIFPELGIGSVTNEYGFYSIKVPEGKQLVQVSFLGYATLSRELEITGDTTLDFIMNETSESLSEVVVTDNRVRSDISNPQMSVNTLDIA